MIGTWEGRGGEGGEIRNSLTNSIRQKEIFVSYSLDSFLFNVTIPSHINSLFCDVARYEGKRGRPFQSLYHYLHCHRGYDTVADQYDSTYQYTC